MSSCDCENFVCEGEPCHDSEMRKIVGWKEHMCAVCPFPIRKGEEHELWTGTHEGRRFRERRHLACRRFTDEFVGIFADGSCVPTGGMPELLRCAEACLEKEDEDLPVPREDIQGLVQMARDHIRSARG